MSTTETPAASETGAVDPSVSSLYEGTNFGDKAALDAIFNEEFGLPDPEAAGGEPAANGKGKDEPAAPAPTAAKGKDGEHAEDPDIKTIREINARSRARREAKERARVAAAPPAQAAPAPAAAAPAPAAAPAAPAPAADVAKAVGDVLAEIQRLAADDARPAAEAQPKDERAAAILALQGKLEDLAKTATASAEIQKKLDDATGRLAAIETTARNREVNARYITEQVKPILAELPLLRAHRPTLEEPRTAIEMIELAAGRYLEKFKVVPDMRDIARRIEKHLQPDGAETKRETPPTPKSKTVSSKLGSPPAARSGPDKRSKDEVEADLWKAFDLEAPS